MTYADDILTIEARDTSRSAVHFKGELTDGLRELLDDHGLVFVDDLEDTPEAGTRCFIDGDTAEDTMAIFPDYYFVSYGPYWEVLSSEEFHEDFEVELE